MKKNILMRTNIFVCVIIILGFIITSVISYQSNIGIFEKDVEHVSDLASEGIYYQIDSMFTRPINVSQTMANDSLLKTFLSNETQNLDQDFIQEMRDYLNAYHQKYDYDSVFLVSTQTQRYYHFSGLDRTLHPGNPENVWYYKFIETDEEYSLNIDNDEASDDEITVFINCKIKDAENRLLGIVGVGFRIRTLQDLLKSYEKDFDVHAYLVDSNGKIEISTQQDASENVNIRDNIDAPELRSYLTSDLDHPQANWYTSQNGKGYMVCRYISNLGWHLIIDNDTDSVNRQIRDQLLKGILVITVIIVLVLFTITTVIRRYNNQIIQLTTSQTKKYYEGRQQAVQRLYENIYELDITHNCAVGEQAAHYFESLGLPANTPYDAALKIIAAKQVKKEHRQGYLDMFSPEHVLHAYQNGTKSLSYDFMITNDGIEYHWMRIMACIYFWSEDQSIRMTAYRQNIETEKQQELLLFEQMKSDPLSGLYNKAATAEMVSETLSTADPHTMYAFFIADIDDFKNVNDTFGHVVGDSVISRFSHDLKSHFSENDIVGRIGGDEFAVFLRAPDLVWIQDKAQELVSSLHRTVTITEDGSDTVSVSIGISIYPDAGTSFETLYKNADAALYHTKRNGKNGFTIYTP